MSQANPPCPIAGCTRPRAALRPLCSVHWPLLPAPLKRELLAAWRAGGPFSRAYLDLLDVAKDELRLLARRHEDRERKEP